MKLVNFKYDSQNKKREILRDFEQNQYEDFRGAFLQIFFFFARNGNIFTLNKDLNEKSNWYETKNYKWIGMQGKGFKLLVRWFYDGHMTLIFKDEKEEYYYSNEFSFVEIYTDDDLKDALNVEKENEIEIWSYINPILKKVIESYMGKFTVLWTIPEEDWIKVRKILDNESVESLDKFYFVLEEIEAVNKYVLESLLEQLCKKYIGIKFNIEAFSDGCFTEIVEKNENIYISKTKDDGTKDLKDLWYIVGWDFNAIYGFLKCLSK